ncbi:3-hydroxy-9,10-secoandrosta-1,3,5(10)-triene-9,17-dione monooxygenase reductase subunit [Nocardioides campestrisoli]|uniref:3-hydroxy-9,10-secoandrosta-1,3,5(10)-triene-9, 17-dione monooxygenase reductase subunit n=1 Tax=Nocardioides campestrisoli TaxID=2736757 RepID=UPI00163DA576|nr:3-hydroxy-9,10-secoandrosta-1,3,5(10)-triene-9,17-dione monooxygenase reductase subunit [Nocardioides campestrisoli]
MTTYGRAVPWQPDDDLYPEADGLVDHARFRDVLGRFASGITVVTATHDGVPVGLTCQSFTSVSLDPPLVLFCPSRASRAWPLIERAGRFCVNVLAADQADVSHAMASRGIDKFAQVGWRPSAESGSPVLDGVLAHLECTLEAVHDGGDHHVVLGRVQHLQVDREGDALLYFKGDYTATGQSNV